MKPLVIAAAFASAVAGTVIASGSGEPAPRNPADAIRGYCARFHGDYDRERCFTILAERLRAENIEREARAARKMP
jgi:hypothetical protein